MKLSTIITLLMVSPFLLTAATYAADKPSDERWTTHRITDQDWPMTGAGVMSEKYNNSFLQVVFMPPFNCQPALLNKTFHKGWTEEGTYDGDPVTIRIDKHPAITLDTFIEDGNISSASMQIAGAILPWGVVHQLAEGYTLRLRSLTGDGDVEYDRFTLKGSKAAILQAAGHCRAVAEQLDASDPDKDFFQKVPMPAVDADAQYF